MSDYEVEKCQKFSFNGFTMDDVFREAIKSENVELTQNVIFDEFWMTY
ncbi:MAG: hypothetical protein N4A49_07515 [Marinifilaceae bacterium]|jgi:hypothetical protein|nr:hypothetical protein [Marinifilaceae bacterium]